MSGAAIYAEDLAKRFGDVVAVDGVNLAIQPGTILGSPASTRRRPAVRRHRRTA